MNKTTTAPLTKTQTGIYIECLNNPNSTLYSLPFLAKLGSSIDIIKLKQAIEENLAAHPCLETVIYTDQNGEIMQKISAGICNVEIIKQSDEEFLNTQHNLVRPFDMNGGCLARFEIYQTPSANYFFEDIHHIIMDGTSHHICEFKTETGELAGYCGGQGYSADSQWSRGQAWAIYGF
ncbi:MAG: hypothetical protein IJX24_06885, partial [Oscillospiraceae bacterium]|nr:hypothetical protein [Oscillospiraceae bacterium]